MGERCVRATVGCALAALTLLSACASESKVREADLNELLQSLPGAYDNSAQVQADIQQGVQPPHDRVALAIVPIDAPMASDLGKNLFYLQEMAGDDPRRIMTQRVLAFDVGDAGIVERSWYLTDPVRWRNGHLNTDLFRALVVEDLGAVPGCELVWKKTADRFVGSNDPKRCHTGSHGGGGLAQVQYKAEVGPDELALAEIAYDRAGRLVQGRNDEPFYRFRKQGP